MSFSTLKSQSEGFYKDRGSKFLSFAFPVQNEEEVKVRLDELKLSYPDARHVCYAFVLGANQDVYRASDDGEPNNSAGAPILGQLRSNNLTNVLVAVVRYFGGTKLGVPGLIQAYKESTTDAINQARLLPFEEMSNVVLVFSYEQSGMVDQLIGLFENLQIEKVFEVECKFTIRMPKQIEDEFKSEAERRRLKVEGGPTQK